MHLKRLGTQAGILVTALLVAVGCASAGTGTARPGGVVHLVLWSGYAPPPIGPGGAEYWSLRSIIASFERLHPKIRISMPYVNSDYALEKASVALQGGEQPDISYQYGTNMPQVARLPGVADLTKTVKQPAWDWNDFPRAERLAVTVDGRVLGIPALVDNLAVVYNKTLFTRHHLPLPRANWTWNELAADAKAITDPAGNTFGLAFPADGSETTVWQFEAMLWEAGGRILTPGNTRAAFGSMAGTRALAMLGQMQRARSLFLDPNPTVGKSEHLFNAGKLGMIITGPWDLSSFPAAHYGVQYMPAFKPGGNHQTIAGPDNWVVFDNGPARARASLEFLHFLTSPRELLKYSLATGALPTRASVLTMPSFPQFGKKYPGAGVFAANLRNVRQTRPQIIQYPQVSSAIGRAVLAVLHGRAAPRAALSAAAQQADGYLVTGG